MASQAARISSAFLPAGVATSLSSPSPYQKQELSFCRSDFCGAATQTSPSSLHVSMFSQIFLQTKGRISRGHCLCGAASSSRQFGAAAAASAVAESSSRSSTGVKDKEQSSSACELPKNQDVKTGKSSGPKYLLGRSEEDLMKLCISLGEQKYRGRQIHQLIYRTKAKNIDDFQHIPKSLREALTNEGWQVGRAPVHHIARSLDGTIKVLLRLEDNRLVETVGIPVFGKPGKFERLTACVSSQVPSVLASEVFFGFRSAPVINFLTKICLCNCQKVGCALKCSFCATGKGGFARNLRPHEIVEQVLVVGEMFQARVSNVVFMGMGEPLMNLPALIPAIRTLNQDVSIGQRMMTISTVGVPNTIARLASHKLQSNLAISLHAPNQQLRTQIVPSAKAYPLESLLTDCRNYFHETGRRVSIEYTLLSGINDKPEHAEELARLLHHWKLGRHVNVLAYNPIADSEFRRPNNAQVKAFVDALNNQRVTASIRRTRGLDANAACGQLRNDFQKVAMMDSEVPMMASKSPKDP